MKYHKHEDRSFYAWRIGISVFQTTRVSYLSLRFEQLSVRSIEVRLKFFNCRKCGQKSHIGTRICQRCGGLITAWNEVLTFSLGVLWVVVIIGLAVTVFTS